ncbi:MAG: glycohydrolase toxin TNT-related protein [Verrucomicrobia bacterium]|nr:glycohydrolase toxin TNT-related protein [Verrucomicrobiota bacterium]
MKAPLIRSNYQNLYSTSMNRHTLSSLALILSGWTLFAADPTPHNSGGEASKQDRAPTPSGQLNFQTDLFTGRFGYTVPIQVAPGRNGGEPQIALRYSSAGENTWCGQGWDLDLGYIQREIKKGVPVRWTNGYPVKEYDESKGFVFSLGGQSAALVKTAGNEYRAEIDSAFFRFNLITNSGGSLTNYWLVTDKSGHKYFFGAGSNSRMANPKTAWPSNEARGTFRWALSRVETVTGDTTAIIYTNLAGVLYPFILAYNGHTSGPTNSHFLRFQLEDRTDRRLSYASGYRVELTKRLAHITNTVSGRLVRRYQLAYTNSPSTLKSLLSSVTMFGTNNTSALPPVSFSYTVQPFQFQAQANWTNVLIHNQDASYGLPFNYQPQTGRLFADVVDMNGDGLPDRLLTATNASAPWTNFLVQPNTGAGFGPAIVWGPMPSQAQSNNAAWCMINSGFTRLLDINADGIPDRVMDPAETYYPYQADKYSNLVVELGTGQGFAPETNWTNVRPYALSAYDPIPSFCAIENSGFLKMADMNGDGLPDRVMRGWQMLNDKPFTNFWVQFNTGSGFTGTNCFGPYYSQGQWTNLWDAHDWWSVEGAFVRLLDINGDGLSDRVMQRYALYMGDYTYFQNFTNFVIEYNNGYGFEPATNWLGVDPQYHQPADGWACGEQYTDIYCTLTNSPVVALADINGDGLPDRIMRKFCVSYTNWMVQINLGNGFAPVRNFGPCTSQGYADTEAGGVIGNAETTLLDINGDGLTDRVMRKYNGTASDNYFVVELNKGPFPDLLSVVSNSIGGSLTVAYKPSTQYDNRESTNSTNSRRLLPFPIYTVSAVSVADGFYPSNTTTYAYEGGMWSPARREFHGFAHVTARDPLGATNGYWFHQAGGRDNSALGEYQDSTNSIGKKGLPFRVETFGTNGQPYKLVLNKVEENVETNGHRFPYVNQTMALDYPDSSAAYRATAQQFQYDLTTGNLTNVANYGEVTNINAAAQNFSNVDSDEVYQFTTFAVLSNTNVLNKAQRITITADAGGQTVLRETLCDYDGATGNLLMQRERICDGNYTIKRFHYDGYGNHDSVTNEANVVTQMAYDTAYQTFPRQQVTANGFTNATQYDPLSGALLSSTDPKGLVSSNAYDVFFRLTTNWVSSTPNGTANVWLTRCQYGLGAIVSGLSKNFVRIQKADGVDTANGHETWTYSDGLGRGIQQRIESETNGTFRVTDTVYDSRGNTRLETQPYFSSNTNYTTLDNTTKLSTSRDYDPIGRPTKTTPGVNVTFNNGLLQSLSETGGDTGSQVGPIVTAYNDSNNPWAMVRTDEESKVRKFYLDAFGRTNQIVEVNGGDTYTTKLFYDKTGLLTNITDYAQNVIEFAYNDLGQLVATADPDMGVWEYHRDFAGRLREQIDAKTNLVRFHYDDPLGRLRSRQVFNPQSGLVYAITNTYDSSDDGNFTVYSGQLYKTTDSEGWQKHSYDLRGRALKTARYLAKNGQTYTTTVAYDDADRVTAITYPTNGPVVTNIYHAGFALSQVKQVGGSNTVYYTARGFDALGQLLGVNFGNGVITTNDYYTNSHRLRKVVTYKSGSTNIQGLTYTYDKVSNLKSIGDGVYSSSASAALTNLVYDDLHRLTSLTRSAVGQTATFSYNAIGNMTANGEFLAGTYNYGVRMPHAVKSVSTNYYAYDASGNMIVRANRQRLDFNEENRLARVLTLISTNAPRYMTNTFGYDANGARLWKQGTNALQVWIGDFYEERNGQRLYHIQADGRRVCTFDGAATNILEYYHSDHLHSSSVLTDGNGNRVQHHEYSAYGRDRFTESSTAFPVSRRYTGQVLDEDTGLYFYGARYYDADLGRFVQPDVVISDLSNPQSYNRYTYTLNNPLKYVDPNGHQPVIARPPRQMDLPLQASAPRIYPRGTLPDHLRTEMVENLMRSPNRPTSISAPGSRFIEPPQMEFALQPPQARAVEIRTPQSPTQTMPSGSSRNAPPSVTAEAGAKESSTALQQYYPANNGFLGQTTREFLYPGQRMDRYGGTDASRFFSPAGTPEPARSLPAGSSGQSLRTFEVRKPFEVESGRVAPAFGQPGLGPQLRAPVPMKTLINREIIREVTP